jgi:hypothetical protein
MKSRRVYDEVHNDEPIPSIQFCPIYSNNLATCGEDGLMAVLNIESEVEDDYLIINLEQAGMRVGHLGLVTFGITMNGV